MKSGTIIMLAVASMLAPGVAVASGSGTTSTRMAATRHRSHETIYHEEGTIGSLKADQLVLDHTWNGKPVTTTFSLESRAKNESDTMQKGEPIVVTYHLEDGQRVATNLRAETTQHHAETKRS